VIIDSSLWIDYFDRGSRRASRAIERLAADGGAWYLLPCILQEVLQGAGSPAHWSALQQLLDKMPMLVPPDPVQTAREAAHLYARCRWRGITPRGQNDCLIAASCLMLDQPLMHSDRDFTAIARIEPRLELVSV